MTDRIDRTRASAEAVTRAYAACDRLDLLARERRALVLAFIEPDAYDKARAEWWTAMTESYVAHVKCCPPRRST